MKLAPLLFRPNFYIKLLSYTKFNNNYLIITKGLMHKHFQKASCLNKLDHMAPCLIRTAFNVFLTGFHRFNVISHSLWQLVGVYAIRTRTRTPPSTPGYRDSRTVSERSDHTEIFGTKWYIIDDSISVKLIYHFHQDTVYLIHHLAT